MNKVVKSLALTFALAAGLGGGVAEAQTAGMPPQPASAYTQVAQTGQVSQQDIDNFAYNIGVQTAYPGAGLGFSQGTLPGGQHVGIEYSLTGNQYTVRSAYNLDNPSDAQSFQGEVNRAANTQASYQSTGYQVVYPQTYLYVEPVIAVRPFGFLGIYGWYAGYEPVFTPWFGCEYFGGRGYHQGYGRDGYRNDVRNVVVNNTTIINERGGNSRSLTGQQGARPVGRATGVDTRVDTRSFQGTFHGAALPQHAAATPLRTQASLPANENGSMFRGNSIGNARQITPAANAGFARAQIQAQPQVRAQAPAAPRAAASAPVVRGRR